MTITITITIIIIIIITCIVESAPKGGRTLRYLFILSES